MKKLIVELTEGMHQELKQRAVQSRRTIREIVTELLREYLSGMPREPHKESTGLCGEWKDERIAGDIVADIKGKRRWFKRKGNGFG